MTTYKWDALKRKAARELMWSKRVVEGAAMQGGTPNYAAITAVLAAVIEDKDTNWKGKLEELQKEVEKMVMQWDVRCAKKLIDLTFHHGCPIIAAKYKNRTPTAEMDDNLGWIIIYS